MFIKKFLSLAVCTALFSPTYIIAANFNQKVSGKGAAIIEGDVETTQNTAMVNAKKNLVLTALNRLLGTNITESDEMFSAKIPTILEQFDNFAEITNKTPSREGASLIISISANLDEVEFRSLLKDLGVGLNQQTRDVGSIVIFFDETEKPYDQPQDMFNEYVNYKRDNSTTYKEKNSASSAKASASALSVKDKASGSYSNQAAINSKSSNQAAYSNQYAGQANDGYSNAAVAASSKGAVKSSDSLKASSSSKGAYAIDYQKQTAKASASSSKSSGSINETHMDKEEFTYKKEYRIINEAPVNSGYVKAELQKILKQYGLQFIEGSGKLAEFNKIHKTKYTSYTEISESADSSKFNEFVKKVTNADFMGIAYSQINYALKADDTTGKYGCTTTQSSVNIFSLKDSKALDSGALEAIQQSNSNIEGCKSNARFDMALNLAQTVGIGIQKTIRDATRSFASGPVSYKLIVQGSFDRPTRRGFENIMETMKTQFKSFKLIAQDAKSIQYEVTYSGKKNIGDALLDAATSPEYTNLNNMFKVYDIKINPQNTIVLYPTR